MTYRCPKCGCTDLRLWVGAVVSLSGDGRTELEDFDHIGTVDDQPPTAFVRCNNDEIECDHAGELWEFTEGAEPLAPVPPLVIEYHYDDSDIGAHPEESEAAKLLWRGFSRSPSHKPVKIVIRPATPEESADATP